MRIIEGTPEEISEYLRRTERAAKPEERPDPVEQEGSPHPWSDIERYVYYSRGMEQDTTRRIVAYLKGVAAIPRVHIQPGLTRDGDGFGNVVLILDSANRHLAPVASLDATYGVLRLRLSPHEMKEVGDGLPIDILDVPTDSQDTVECPLVRDEAVELALKLTTLALRTPRP
ncbi:hypothetical protein [Streptomyces sp. NPDC005573]|uniref:hypothetical protein n=1 Tax=unclassified Streptomyces TaxID=2593676 RepID=UPI0033BEFDED